MSRAARGLRAEDAACAALAQDGFTILGRRLRTPAGEIDIAACRGGLLVFAEVKHRPDLAQAAAALLPRQQARLLAAAEILLAMHPDWARPDIRFDLLITDQAGRMRRVTDILRLG